MAIPEKRYSRLEALLEKWNITKDDVFYAIENGLLQCCAWLQPRYMECVCKENGCLYAKAHRQYSGLVWVRPEDCQTIFQDHEVMAYSFIPMDAPEEILRITLEPPQPYICLRLPHLLVMREEQQRFEQAYNIRFRKKHRGHSRHRKHKPTQSGLKTYNDYKEVILRGRTYHLGEVQAGIVRQLHEASTGQNPWIHGKTLLANSGSQAMRFQDVFKNKKDWRNMIESDGRGYYRLNTQSKQLKEPPADSSMERYHAAQ